MFGKAAGGDYFFPCHKIASVSFVTSTMANVYGMTYDPSCSDAGPSPAVNSNTDTEPTTTTSSTRKFKSRIHREGYEMDMQRKEKKRLKTEEKAQKLMKKIEREKKRIILQMDVEAKTFLNVLPVKGLPLPAS